VNPPPELSVDFLGHNKVDLSWTNSTYST